MPHVKAAGDGSTPADFYGKVEAIFRAERIILTGIKNKSQNGGVVDQRIVDHTFKSIIKGEKREEEVTLPKNPYNAERV
jgi:hypothetical protein